MTSWAAAQIPLQLTVLQAAAAAAQTARVPSSSTPVEQPAGQRGHCTHTGEQQQPLGRVYTAAAMHGAVVMVLPLLGTCSLGSQAGG